MERNICKQVLSKGGTLVPLLIDSINSGGTGLMNPSIIEYNGDLLVNLRHVNYVLYHSEESQLFQNRWGPLAYLNPENDVKLKTINWICKLNPETLQVSKYYKVDTTELDIAPLWDFHGLEDARIVEWHGRLFLSGVRRDVKENGEGRIELSEIEIEGNNVKEISRFRIPAINEESYCEKNWMPIEDMPFHYIKWTNPTELVVCDPVNKTSKSLFTSTAVLPIEGDLRGGSVVINYKDYRIALVHEVRLFRNKLQQKDAKYFHRFVTWDKDWNIIHMTQPFSFLTAEVEFSCGMIFYKEDLLITFGFQDNAAYLLKIPKEHIESFIYEQ